MRLVEVWTRMNVAGLRRLPRFSVMVWKLKIYLSFPQVNLQVFSLRNSNWMHWFCTKNCKKHHHCPDLLRHWQLLMSNTMPQANSLKIPYWIWVESSLMTNSHFLQQQRNLQSQLGFKIWREPTYHMRYELVVRHCTLHTCTHQTLFIVILSSFLSCPLLSPLHLR